MEYKEILSDLAEKWLLTEVNHRVSREASDQFWALANNMFHRLYLAKGNFGRKVPQFQTLRAKMYMNRTPPVQMEIGYQCKETGEISVVKEATSTPVARFPPCTYRRLYEIGSVDVRKLKKNSTQIYIELYVRTFG